MLGGQCAASELLSSGGERATTALRMDVFSATLEARSFVYMEIFRRLDPPAKDGAFTHFFRPDSVLAVSTVAVEPKF